MDTFVCSSWYQYAYISPYYEGEVPFDPMKGKYWLPVDQYTGGIEHAVMHLLYTRFFTKAMRDIGLVDFSEPMLHLYNQGIILGEDGHKMSKSRGNVVNPDDLVAGYGVDTFRTYLMFIGPWEKGGPWSSRGIEGVHRFLNRVWKIVLGEKPPTAEEGLELQKMTHKTLKKVTEDIESFKFNTAVATLMDYVNFLYAQRDKGSPEVAWREAMETLMLMLAPIAPHLAEELWMRTGHAYSIHQQPWPEWSEELIKEEFFTLVVQVDGKVRDRLEVPATITEEEAKELALSSRRVQRRIVGKEVIKVIYVSRRLVNIVTC